jgi:hypothetical protein
MPEELPSPPREKWPWLCRWVCHDWCFMGEERVPIHRRGPYDPRPHMATERKEVFVCSRCGHKTLVPVEEESD